MKKKQPITKVLQKKCDSYLTDIAKHNNPMCEAGCGRHTQVGHHWVEKSRSARLRYDIDNIVSLCNICHGRIHNKFRNNVIQSVDIALTIIGKRGQEWHNRLKQLQPETIKTNKGYYEEQLEFLSNYIK